MHGETLKFADCQFTKWLTCSNLIGLPILLSSVAFWDLDTTVS